MTDTPLSKLNLGAWGENVVARYLQDYGYHIVARNWRFGRMGELDAVVMDTSGTLTAIEVKTGIAGNDINPVEQLTPVKIQRLTRLMQAFMTSHPDIKATNYAIDGIVVQRRGSRAHIQHYHNIAA